MEFIGLNGSRYVLQSSPLGSGGEGEVYKVENQRNLCAKIYKPEARKPELGNKLLVMTKNPPDSSVLSQIAWPLDLLYSSQRELVGFVMPLINVSGELKNIYEYPPRDYKDLTFKQKLKIAQNVCLVIDYVHEAGFVFGDFNPNNIGVDIKTGQVAFWDTDTYHIYDNKTGITYRCEVCLDGYVAPELLSKIKRTNNSSGKKYNYSNLPLDTFTVETDNFALAIHIFKLMMNGFTPFGGIVANQAITSTTAPGPGNIAVERDAYCFKPGNTHMSRAVPGKHVLPTEIVDLFDRAFISGKSLPASRPNAKEWYDAIGRFSNNLVQCRLNPTHQYLKTLSNCPWCEVDKRFNVGISKVSTPIATIPTIAPLPTIAPYPYSSKPTIAPLPAIAPYPYSSNTNATSQSYSQNKPQRKLSKKAMLTTLLMCIITILVFCIYDVIKWQIRITPSGYKNYTNEISLDSSHFPNEYRFAGTLEPNETDEYIITAKTDYLSINFITYTSDHYHGVDIKIIREDGSYQTFNSFKSNKLFGDGYEIDLPEEGTYRLQVSCPYHTDYVVILKGYISSV